MGSLFLKLFLWLWLTGIIIAGAFVVSWHHWAPASSLPSQAELEQVAEEISNLYAEEGGWGAVHGYLRSLSRDQKLRFVLLGQDELATRGMQRRMLRGLSQQDREILLDTAEDRGRLNGMLYKRVVVDFAGAHDFYLIALHPVEGLGGLPVWLRAVIALAVTGGLAGGLAAYLSRPLRRLRRASQALASGDLHARVPVVERGGDEIAALGRDFNAMAERLESLVEAQNRLLRDISHELRSPLSRLQVALELARRETSGDSNALAKMENDIERMDQLIGQLLTLARLESGAGASNMESVDLHELIGQVCEDAQFEAQASGCNVLKEDGPRLQITGDRHLLRSALENVLRNALRYTPAGGVINVAWQRDQDGIWVSVIDSGPGVSEERLNDLFEPFVRLSAARERDSGSCGLGLAIVRRAVQAHGGSVAAHNRPQGGLEVRFWLPLKGPAS
ncbi:ATP-binding protein [Halorhodospira halochloris]|uniref:ATP-binding protein n=1 Tax=Halorhodospira halochloris TaxID=1052 RepID=UPI001EE8AA41|nr:ATP-binding protein [Halorhodospira halochloris]MCG5531713.1 ATP-binding protein [Halorhodospira halochloris]